MKHLIFAPFLLASTAALAGPLTIAAGKPSNDYDKAAQTLSKRLSQRATPATVANYNGSDEITLALCANEADIGYTQIDAIYARQMDGCSLKPIALFGLEYASIWFAPDAKQNELEDLTAESTILVDTVGSGSDLFWTTIKGIETNPDIGSGDEWAQAHALYEPIDLAPMLASLGEIDAVLLVRKPNSADLGLLQESGFKLGWVYDKDINDLMFNNTPLYQSDSQYQTYEVRSFLAAGPRFDQSLLRKVQGASK